MIAECENLDAYLDAELSPAESDRFEAHMHVCEKCQEAVNQQRWIDALLGSPERLELEPVAPALSRSVRNSIPRRRQARLVACGLAAAAVLVVAVGWTAALERQVKAPAVNHNHVAEKAVHDEEPYPSPSLKARNIAEAPRATFVSGPDVLAVPVASRHPNVTIVRVYPAFKSSLAPEAASDESDADYFNGG